MIVRKTFSVLLLRRRYCTAYYICDEKTVKKVESQTLFKAPSVVRKRKIRSKMKWLFPLKPLESGNLLTCNVIEWRIMRKKFTSHILFEILLKLFLFFNRIHVMLKRWEFRRLCSNQNHWHEVGCDCKRRRRRVNLCQTQIPLQMHS